MSENATATVADATPPASPETAAPIQAKAEATPAQASAAPDPSVTAMRQALLRAQVAQVLGPVPAPWVLDAAISAARPDLLSDYTGLTGPSRERISQWKAENAFAFAQATQTAQAVQGANVQTTQQTQAPAKAAEPLPATPTSSVGATSSLSTDELRRLGQVHVNPADITRHPDWSRVKAFWGVA